MNDDVGAHRQDRIPEVSHCEERGSWFQGFQVIVYLSLVALEPRVKQSIMAGNVQSNTVGPRE